MPHQRILIRLAGLAATTALAMVVAACSGTTGAGSTRSSAPPSASPVSSSHTAPSSAPTPSAATRSVGVPSTGSTVPSVPASLGGLPLYPFATLAQAREWEQAFESGGHQPWHLDAGSTALSFTQGYLGYSGINLVVNTAVHGREAKVAVGYLTPNGTKATAAILHLARMGPDRDAPWEVVGSEDTTLTVTSPRYGGTTGSPARVGGLVTGVDESLSIQILAIGYQAPIGQVHAIAAGGQRAPWSADVPFSAPAGLVVTIAVATGGHTAPVERFAITGATTR